MYIDKTFADVTINVSGIEFKAHRSVLAAASPYFEKALQYERTEQNNHNPVPQFIEGAQRAFSFPEENVQAFARVLRYMYVRSYSDQPDGELNTPGEYQATRAAAHAVTCVQMMRSLHSMCECINSRIISALTTSNCTLWKISRQRSKDYG